MFYAVTIGRVGGGPMQIWSGDWSEPSDLHQDSCELVNLKIVCTNLNADRTALAGRWAKFGPPLDRPRFYSRKPNPLSP